MRPSEWARSVKPQLIAKQASSRVPAFHMAAQQLHEGFNPDGSLSRLAAEHNNFGGLTWFEDGEEENWQRQFGAEPVVFETREVIGGKDVMVRRPFASYPSYAAFLDAYVHLLSNPAWRFARLLPYAGDPLLYCNLVVRAGWATETAGVYTNAVAAHMAIIFPDYADTLAPAVSPVACFINAQTVEGMRLEDGRTVGPVRPWLDVLARHGWHWAFRNNTLMVYEPMAGGAGKE